ncbi:hypothetical protein [Psychrobacter sp. P2G3]|uniref:hypothetical protein n=1 Tax=Psychrobacter sp. P2G3 TaxID=1699622 RepID=UPI00078DD6E9|nr:hypothetical protein [Psychrobacter sp. P2G3]AMN49383.1 hypothetical protein AK823_05410 [Psychrobacter sp. P2G3]
MSDIKAQYSEQSKYTHRYTPRHPLAEYAVSQIGKLELRAQDIVQTMGYSSTHAIAACDRLRHVLSSEILGLNDTAVDTHFTAHEFLRDLLFVLDIAYKPYADDIAKIEYDLAHYPYPLPRYSLRADINFVWSGGANWMSRGVASSKANAYLPENIAKMNDSEREAIVQQCIEEHYQKYHGHLPYKGVIKSYQLIIKQRDEIIGRVEYGLPVKL